MVSVGDLLFSSLYVKLDYLIQKVNLMAGELDALRSEVSNNTTVSGSAVALLQGLKAALDAAVANNDMSAVKALADQLGANDRALADAVAANTPNPPQP